MTKKNNILASLNQLKEKDVYSMLLYILYKLKDDEKYSTLSTLIWALDKNSLLNFLSIFEGVEMKVPKISDLKVIVSALQLYQLVDIEGKKLDESIEELQSIDVSEDDLKNAYFKICDMLSEGEIPNVQISN